MTAFMLLLALAQGQDFTWSGSIASGKRLTVKNVIGDVRVELTNGSTASVTGTKILMLDYTLIQMVRY